MAKRFAVFTAVTEKDTPLLSWGADYTGEEIIGGIIVAKDRPEDQWLDLFTYVQNATKGDIFRPSNHTAIVCTRTR